MILRIHRGLGSPPTHPSSIGFRDASLLSAFIAGEGGIATALPGAAQGRAQQTGMEWTRNSKNMWNPLPESRRGRRLRGLAARLDDFRLAPLLWIGSSIAPPDRYTQMPSSPTGLSLFVVETSATLLIIGAGFAFPRLGSKRFSVLERVFSHLARRRSLSVCLVAASALALRLLILPLLPIPEPFVHDEFSYLLASDTFASGRLTNPTHPMWVHFESFHIDQQPTYMSMYFLGQGMALALGKILFGHPWYGVWLTSGLMCGAICWMLQQWLPPGWALLGGMLAVIRLGIFSYWTNSYNGGALAAVGGALVLGSLPRITRHRSRLPGALIMGLGIAILANTRPYEGFLLCIPVAMALSIWLVGKGRESRAVLARQFVLPLVLILAATGAAMGYYNWRVFGNWATLPYELNRATYAVAQHFVWQKPRPEPVYRHKVMRDFYVSTEMREVLEARTPLGFLKRTLEKIGISGFFFFGVVLLIPLPAVFRAIRSRRLRFLAICGAVYVLGLALNVWLFPHYLAPVTALLYAILLQAMRYLRHWRPGGEPVGLFLVRAVPVVCIVLCAVRVFAGPLHITVERWPSMWYGTAPLGLPRASVLKQLTALPGRHLAIVRYAADHNPVDDWVYNAADIDGSRVVWAREMDPAETSNLVRYFHDRRLWLVEPDCDPVRVSPYPGTAATADVRQNARCGSQMARTAAAPAGQR